MADIADIAQEQQQEIKPVNNFDKSKFINGKAITDDNGKIVKGEHYFEPDLKPFTGGDDER